MITRRYTEDTASERLPNLNFSTDNRKALVDSVGTRTLTQNTTLATRYVDSDTKMSLLNTSERVWQTQIKQTTD